MLLRKSEKTTPSESHEFHGIRGWKSSQLAWNLETSTKCAASSIGDFEINHKKSCKKGVIILEKWTTSMAFIPVVVQEITNILLKAKHKILWMMPVTTTTMMMIIMTMMIRDLFPIRNLFWGLIFHVAGFFTRATKKPGGPKNGLLTPFTPQITGLGLRSLKCTLHHFFAVFCYSRWVSGYNKPIWELCHVLWRCTFPLNNTGWWFQPIWKILVKMGGENKKMFETTT